MIPSRIVSASIICFVFKLLECHRGRSWNSWYSHSPYFFLLHFNFIARELFFIHIFRLWVINQNFDLCTHSKGLWRFFINRRDQLFFFLLFKNIIFIWPSLLKDKRHALRRNLLSWNTEYVAYSSTKKNMKNVKTLSV